MIPHRFFPNLLTVVFGATLALALAPSFLRAAPSPNIVFILADDLGWNGIGPYGNKDVSTPHLDRLAREAPRRAEEYVPHIVRRGETLTGLARRYRTSPEVLRQLNRLEQDEIQVGQRLRVPKVTAADTLP
jgi:hypothetical protein